MKRIFLFFALLAAACSSEEPKTLYVVDCNGGGDFTSVQACFDALPSKSAAWRTVRIMPGTYREKVTLDVYKDKVAIVGAGTTPDEVRIVWNDFSGKVVDSYEMTTYDCYTMSIQADEVLLQNLTVANDAGRVGQAVALETRGDRIRIDRCRLLGDQDTFFTKGYVSRLYVSDSYIEGTTDFIFGPSIVLFDDCTIHA
ncbi:MAG: pectin methylesterase, partial [Alistipes sp.]|nr:pectin methylesterase [Alistipes sp.]